MDVRIVRPAPPGGAGQFVVEGWKNASDHCGIDFDVYTEAELDAAWEDLRKYPPTHILLDVGNKSDLWLKVAREFRRDATVLVAVHHLPKEGDPPIPTLCEQGLLTSVEDIQWVKQVKPDGLVHQATPQFLSRYWSGWRQHYNGPLYSLPLAGDVITQLRVPVQERRYAWCYIGGWWPRKAVPGLFAYLMPAAVSAYGIAVGCRPVYDILQSLGVQVEYRDRCNTKERAEIYSQSAVAIHVHEPHARMLGGEVAQRVFDSPLAGCVGVTDGNPDVLQRPWGLGDSHPDAFYSIVVRLWQDREFYAKVLHAQFAYVCAQETYHDRLAALLRTTGYEDAARLVLTKKWEYIASRLGQQGHGHIEMMSKDVNELTQEIPCMEKAWS